MADAQAILTVLARLAEQMSSVLGEKAELKKALGHIEKSMNPQQQKTKPERRTEDKDG